MAIQKHQNTIEHTYDTCPKYSELGSFRIIGYLYVSDDSRRWQPQYSKKNMTGNGHIEHLKVTKYNFQPSEPR